MKELRLSRQALKALRNIPTDASHLILEKLKQYAGDPSALVNNVRVLKGSNGLFRVGDWRVIFTEDGEVIEIIKIAHRSSIYR